MERYLKVTTKVKSELPTEIEIENIRPENLPSLELKIFML